jgi:outer membrane protein assembly factor BamB
VGYPGAEGAATPAGTAVAASPEAEPVVDRSNLIAWHEEAPFMVGDFPTGLLLIDATAASMEPVTLPATPLWMAFDAGGERLAVLTDDGVVHAVDPATQEILWSTPATTAYAEFDQEDAARLYPFIAVGEDAVYVPDPGAGQVVELSLDSGEVTGRVDVGGEPARLALVAASGVVH